MSFLATNNMATWKKYPDSCNTIYGPNNLLYETTGLEISLSTEK